LCSCNLKGKPVELSHGAFLIFTCFTSCQGKITPSYCFDLEKPFFPKPLSTRSPFRTSIFLLPRCPNSDGDDSRAPALCLICGEMLCSQSYCCQTEVEGDKVGACAAHALKCGAGVGVFLRVRECQILLMTNKNKGCFYSPPYLDAYGETDQGLR